MIPSIFKLNYVHVPDITGPLKTIPTPLVELFFTYFTLSEQKHVPKVCKRFHYILNFGERFMKGQFMARYKFIEQLKRSNPGCVNEELWRLLSEFKSDPKSRFREMNLPTDNLLVCYENIPKYYLFLMQKAIAENCNNASCFNKFGSNFELIPENKYEDRGLKTFFYPLANNILSKDNISKVSQVFTISNFKLKYSLSLIIIIFQAVIKCSHIKSLDLSFEISENENYTKLSVFNNILANAKYIQRLHICDSNVAWTTERGFNCIFDGISLMPKLIYISHRVKKNYSTETFYRLSHALNNRLINKLKPVKDITFQNPEIQDFLDAMVAYPKKISIEILFNRKESTLKNYNSNISIVFDKGTF